MGFVLSSEMVGTLGLFVCLFIKNADSGQEVSSHPVLLKHQLFEWHYEGVLLKGIFLLNTDLGISV